MPENIEYTPDYTRPLVIGARGLDAIFQNIRMIIKTLAFSVPLDRAFAHDNRFIDSPAPVTAARLTSQLWDAIEKYEPRVEVDSIDFEYADVKNQLMQGALTPKIVFHLKKGVSL